MKNYKYDAVIVGSGPNGLAAGICLARANLSVLIVEAKDEIGGGARSSEETLPGFIHDVCSTIHPLGVGSPFFQTLPLAEFGLEYIDPPVSLAHHLDDKTAVTLHKSIAETGANFGADAKNYEKLVAPFVENWNALAPDILAPLRFPNHPFLLAKFGLKSFRSARSFAEKYFAGERARALFAGCAAHSISSLEKLPTAAYGLVLMLAAHAVGWQFARGGTQKITDALAAYFESLGGEFQTGFPVENLDELPASRAVLFDLTPRQIVKIANRRLPANYKRRLENFRYGGGVFKMDFALSEPVPWLAKEAAFAGTVHLGGNFNEVAAAEEAVVRGKEAEKPFVLFVQTSLFDATRAPAGKQTGWAYCHIPNGSSVDMSERIENQIERFAPGFRDCIIAKTTKSAAEMESYNANYIGGDIGGGANILSQLFTRPVARFDPYRIPAEGLYICSASTPPGGGVHGMCGYHAAKSVLANEFQIKLSKESVSGTEL